MLLRKYRDGAGEEAQQLRALTALVEDLSSNPSTMSGGSQLPVNSSPGGI